MRYEFSKITIVKIRKPGEKDVNKDLQWLSNSLGLFSERDKEKSCFRIFIELVKAARRRTPLTSDEIAVRSNLSRANKLIESGLVTPYENRYILRVDNLEELIAEVRKDILRVLDDLKLMAEEIDDQLGLLKR